MLVLGPAVDVVEHAAGEAPPRQPAQVLDGGGPGQPALDAVGLDAPEAHHRAQRLPGAGAVQLPVVAVGVEARVGGVEVGDEDVDALDRRQRAGARWSSLPASTATTTLVADASGPTSPRRPRA